MPEAAPYAGMFVKDADKPIIKDLKAKGLLFKTLEFEHSYPYCWRCDTPLFVLRPSDLVYTHDGR